MMSAMILVVEDDQSLREILVEVLVSWGYRVIEAQDGQEGLAKWAYCDQELSLVITDNDMPRINGIGMVMKARYRGFAQAVILTSGRAVDANLNKYGIMAFLLKPYYAEQLLILLDQVEW